MNFYDLSTRYSDLACAWALARAERFTVSRDGRSVAYCTVLVTVKSKNTEILSDLDPMCDDLTIQLYLPKFVPPLRIRK